MIRSKDLPGLILLIGISVLASFFLSRYLFGNQNLITKVEVVQPITAEFDYQDKPYFFKGALNPTKDIILNENNNPTPLGQ
jgi:hypothetical protein